VRCFWLFIITTLAWAFPVQFARAEQVLESGVVQINTGRSPRTWQYWVIRRPPAPGEGMNFEYRFIDEYRNEIWTTAGYQAQDGTYHFTMDHWVASMRIQGRMKGTVASLAVRLPPVLGQPYRGHVTIQGWFDYEGIFHPINVSSFGAPYRGTEMVFYPQ